MFDTYLHKLDSTQAMFRNRYGQNSRWAEYKEHQLHDPSGFYSRVGNSFLSICREYYNTKNVNYEPPEDLHSHIDLDNTSYFPKTKTYLSEKESDQFRSYVFTGDKIVTGKNNS